MKRSFTYSRFALSDDGLFRLRLGRLLGGGGGFDPLRRSDGAAFSARDADSDRSFLKNCAKDLVRETEKSKKGNIFLHFSKGGAWWFADCPPGGVVANLNGLNVGGCLPNASSSSAGGGGEEEECNLDRAIAWPESEPPPAWPNKGTEEKDDSERRTVTRRVWTRVRMKVRPLRMLAERGGRKRTTEGRNAGPDQGTTRENSAAATNSPTTTRKMPLASPEE